MKNQTYQINASKDEVFRFATAEAAIEFVKNNPHLIFSWTSDDCDYYYIATQLGCSEPPAGYYWAPRIVDAITEWAADMARKNS